MEQNHSYFMSLAIVEAERGIEKGHGGPFGAVVVRDGKVIGSGHNQVLLRKNPQWHGEMVAIEAACKTIDSFDLSGSVLYTTGEPCPMCLATILWANIDKVYYGCTVADNERIGFRDKKFDEKMQINRANFDDMLVEVDRDKCLELFEKYNNIQNKTMY